MNGGTLQVWARLVLVVAILALAGAGCITRTTEREVDHPRAVVQLRALGVEKSFDDALLGELVAIRCTAPPGATKREIEPLLMRRLVATRGVFDAAGYAVVKAIIDLLPVEWCEPARGRPVGYESLEDPSFWPESVGRAEQVQAGLRQALPDNMELLLGFRPEMDFGEPGTLAMRFALDVDAGQQVLARNSCVVVRALVELLLSTDLAPRDMGMLAGAHDPAISITVADQSASHTLDIDPGDLGAAYARCVSGG